MEAEQQELRQESDASKQQRMQLRVAEREAQDLRRLQVVEAERARQAVQRAMEERQQTKQAEELARAEREAREREQRERAAMKKCLLLAPVFARVRETKLRKEAEERDANKLRQEQHRLQLAEREAQELRKLQAVEAERARQAEQRATEERQRRESETATLKEEQERAAETRAVEQKQRLDRLQETFSRKEQELQERLGQLQAEVVAQTELAARAAADAQARRNSVVRVQDELEQLQAQSAEFEAAAQGVMHYVWECNVGYGTWMEYAPEVNDRLEHCHREETCCEFRIRTQNYQIDFRLEQPRRQVNVGTGVEREIRRVPRARAEVVSLPAEWSLGSSDWRLVDDAARMPDIEAQMRASIQQGTTHGMGSLTVRRVMRVENRTLWEQYQRKRRIIGQQMQKGSPERLRHRTRFLSDVMGADRVKDEQRNEFLLWHGTKPPTADILAEWGFDEKKANMGGLYGAGSYFADASSKAHQYRGTRHLDYSDSTNDDGHHCMLLCRVTMGSPFLTQTTHTNERLPPDNPATPGKSHDSIFAQMGVANGGTQHHNEYVVFNSDQVYPECLIYYTV